MKVVGRLKPRAELASARAEATVLAASIAALHPEVGPRFDFRINGLHDQLVGNRRSTLTLLLAVVGAVLLIACVNMASLLLSQAGSRKKEMAIRRALGASGGRLLRQLLTESLLLGLAGGAVGLALCRLSLSVLNSIVPAGYLHSGPIALDWRVTAFTLVLGILCGVLFGLAPAWLTARVEPTRTLRGDGAALTSGGRPRRFSSLVVVGPDYFRTLGIPFLMGREFEESDDQSAAPVAIVNQSPARQLWGDDDPIGRKLMLSSLDNNPELAQRWLTVVGLVADIHAAALDRPPNPAVYAPYLQHPDRATGLDLVVSVRGRAEDFVEPIRRYVREQDADVPPGEVRTLDSWALDTMSQPRFRAGLLSGFGGLAVLLAVLGVYGVMSHAVTLRRKEIAVRMALGARKADILKLLASEGFRFVIIGQIVGSVAALFFTGLMEGMLFQVSATDASVFWIASPLLAAAVLVTCLVPARRAGRLRPMEVIRG